MANENEVKGKPPQAILGEMINGYWVTQTITAAARLGVADHLADGPKSVAALAERVGAHAGSLYRLLRACASIGIFSEDASHAFSQTTLSEALRSGVPGSMRGLAMMTGLLHMRAWPEILHSVRTGETAFKKVFGSEIFEHLPRDPEAARAFDEAMAGYSASTAAAVAAAYDFSKFATIVDVGGGSGALLGAILGRAPAARGINFDLPHCADRARAHFERLGQSARVEVQGGDFFASVPSGDAYTMKMILHDWDDERSIAILRNVRKAIAPGGTLLVLETVIPPGNTPSSGKLLDINMLVMTGGRERTEAEFASLYRAAGFELTRVIPAHPAASVIEGRPV